MVLSAAMNKRAHNPRAHRSEDTPCNASPNRYNAPVLIPRDQQGLQLATNQGNALPLLGLVCGIDSVEQPKELLLTIDIYHLSESIRKRISSNTATSTRIQMR